MATNMASEDIVAFTCLSMGFLWSSSLLYVNNIGTNKYIEKNTHFKDMLV